MPRDNIRDKLEGNELDLSLNNLSVVPVKEMSQLVKGTNVDLSCNLLTSLPVEFCELRHIVRLDLSKNQLHSLPEDLGNLNKLQHLDLFGNQLSTLPVSTFMLKSLKWLDLRDNPLEADLQRVAGDCLNEAECRKCAKNVVEHMRGVQAVMERSRQNKLQEQRELEKRRKAEIEAEEERERQRKKADKLAEKERRRAEFQAKQAAEQGQTSTTQSVHTSHQTQDSDSDVPDVMDVKTGSKTKSGLSCCGVFLTSMVAFLLVFALGFYYCYTHYRDPLCVDVKRAFLPYWTTIEKFLHKYTTWR